MLHAASLFTKRCLFLVLSYFIGSVFFRLLNGILYYFVFVQSGPKIGPLQNYETSYYSLPLRLDFFVKLKCQSSSVIFIIRLY